MPGPFLLESSAPPWRHVSEIRFSAPVSFNFVQAVTIRHDDAAWEQSDGASFETRGGVSFCPNQACTREIPWNCISPAFLAITTWKATI
jgi:hypothetical protein